MSEERGPVPPLFSQRAASKGVGAKTRRLLPSPPSPTQFPTREVRGQEKISDAGKTRGWWDFGMDEPVVTPPTMNVHDGGLMQPIGFVWFGKPRVRVKAGGRKF